MYIFTTCRHMYTVSLDYGLKLRQIKIISVAVHQGNTNSHTHTHTQTEKYTNLVMSWQSIKDLQNNDNL